MCALFLTEAWRIAGQGLRKFILRSDGIDELTDHGMLTGTDQVQVLTLDLVHIMASISAKDITPVTTLLRIMNGGMQ